MTPRGPIGREQAGSPASHPDGALGGCPCRSSGRPDRAPTPGSATDQGGTRPAASAVPVPAGHRPSSSKPTHLSAPLAVDLAVSRCPSHGRFRSCPRHHASVSLVRRQLIGRLLARVPAVTARGLHLLVAGGRPKNLGASVCLERRGNRGWFSRFGLVLPGRASAVILALLPRRSPWLLLGKVGAWLRHRSYRLIR
jgi:hypothetical protein